MMEALHGFTAGKEQLAVALTQLADMFARHAQQGHLERARAMHAKLVDEQLNLVVLGQFKRGKSTLINALLGAELLPTAVVPLTSIVTVVRYGPQPRAVVHFLDGRRTDIAVAELASYSTERDNPDNWRGVAQVEVWFPSELLGNGVRLVDTPGVGSVYAGNTGTTYDYLPQADAALVVLAADQPISQAELAFVRDAQEYAAKLFFVLNKIDALDTNELHESLAFSTHVLAESLGGVVTVYPLSARTALHARLKADHARLDASRLPEFERALAAFLMRDKGTTLLDAMRARVAQLVTEALDAIALELAALRMPVEVLAARRALFHQKADEIRQAQSDTVYLLRGEIGALTARIEAHLRPFVANNVTRCTRQVADAFEQHRHLGRSALIRAMHQAMRRTVEETFAPWRAVEEREVRTSFAHITSRFVERATRIIGDIQMLTTELFDVRLTPSIEVAPLTTESRHSYYTDNPFTLSLATLPLLLLGPLAKRYIRYQFLSRCREELDRNAGRLRADFQDRLTKSAHAFLAVFETQVQATLAGLEETLQRAAAAQQRSTAALATVQERLDADRIALAEIGARVARCAVHSQTLPCAMEGLCT